MTGLLLFMKRNILRFKESREGFCRTGRGRSFHVDGPKTEKVREPTVESLAVPRGIWRPNLNLPTKNTKFVYYPLTVLNLIFVRSLRRAQSELHS